MWSEGSIAILNEDKSARVVFHYQVKHYDEPSETYGIDGGRISKLFIWRDEVYTCRYDREWVLKPEDEDTEKVLAILIRKFN